MKYPNSDWLTISPGNAFYPQTEVCEEYQQEGSVENVPHLLFVW